MNPASPQLRFDLRLPGQRPLVPLEACMVLCDRDEDDLIALVQSGDLAFAWDIRGAKAERRAELRVWRESVLAYLAAAPGEGTRPTGQNGCAPGEGTALPEEEVLERLLPHGRDTLFSTELQRMFSASQTHVQGLIDGGLLEQAGERRQVRGVNARVRVSRESVIQFLKDRRWRG